MTYESPASDDARIDLAALLSAVVRRLPRVIFVTVVLLALTFVYLMFQPRLYESSASILIESRSNAYARASNEQAPSTPTDASVVSSQIELLKSRDTLINVINQLDLQSNPEFNGSQPGFSPVGMIMQTLGRGGGAPKSVDETVLNTLYERLTVIQERDSRIISVLVRSTDPKLAADIANAVANAHVARRAQLSISDTAEASSWLQSEIERLRVSVKDAESAVANFKVANDLFTGSNNTSLLDQQLSTIASQMTDAQQRKNAALSRATLIRDLLARGQSIEAVADVRDSAVIQRLSEEKGRLQGEQAQRSATLLPNHPTIRALNAQIAELDNQIRIEANRVASALESEAQVEDGLVNSLQGELDRTKSSASTATRDTVTLDSLQREAKAQRDLLEAYLSRYNEASSRVDSNSALPDVRVISVAAPAVSPASPKSSMIMMAVGIVSFAFQIGAIAFSELLSGRSLRPVTRAGVPVQDRLEEVPFKEDELEADQRWEEETPVAEQEPVVAVADDVHTEPVPVAVDVPEVEPVAAKSRFGGLRGMFGRRKAVIVEPADVVVPAPESNADAMDELAAELHPMIGDVPVVAEVETPAAEPVAEITEEPVAEVEPVEVADYIEPEAEIAEFVPAPSHERAALLGFDDLVADLVLGRSHLLLLADHDPALPSIALAEELVGAALSKGLSAALIDAGTERRGEVPGLSELSAGQVSFGDVVQKSADNSFAEVAWGQGDAIDRQSSRPVTLVEALGDIYEVVVVLTGKLGRRSLLPDLAELGGRIILVAGDEAQAEDADGVRRQLEEAGLPRVEITALPQSVAA